MSYNDRKPQKDIQAEECVKGWGDEDPGLAAVFIPISMVLAPILGIILALFSLIGES